MDKLGQNSRINFWILLLLVALFISSFRPDFFSGLFGAVGLGAKEVPAITTPSTTVTCSDPSQTMTVGPAKARWNPTTSVSSENHRVFKTAVAADGSYGAFNAGNDEGSKSDSASMTIGWKDKIGIIYGYASSTYYADYVELVAPCNPFSSASVGLTKGIADAHQLIANGSLTVDLFNSDTGNRNPGDGTDNETIGSGEEGKFKVRITTLDETGWSPLKAGILTVELNGSMYDESQTTLAGKVSDASQPKFMDVRNTDSKVVAFSISGCPDPKDLTKKSCDLELGTLKVKAEASPINPRGNGNKDAASVGDGDLEICFHPSDYYLQTVTGEPLIATEKDDGTRANTNFASQCVFAVVT